MSNKNNRGIGSEMNMIDQKYEVEKTSNENVDLKSFDTTLTEPIVGIVCNCNKLRIRKEPSFESDNVLCIVESGTKLMINKSDSTEKWCHVYDDTGMDGFCMKEYIAFK